MRPLALTAILLLATLPISAADECEMTTSAADVTVPIPGLSMVYVAKAFSCLGEGCVLVLVVYSEGNDFEGLQRHDFVHSDTCDGTYPSDTPILVREAG